MKVLLTAALAALAVSFPAMGGTRWDSGISGVVRPAACGPPRTCGRTPAPTSVVVRSARTRALVATVAIRDGRFRVALAPGAYILSLRPVAAAGAPVRVTVRAHEFTLVVLRPAPRLR
jgi:hypothetical protein